MSQTLRRKVYLLQNAINETRSLLQEAAGYAKEVEPVKERLRHADDKLAEADRWIDDVIRIDPDELNQPEEDSPRTAIGPRCP